MTDDNRMTITDDNGQEREVHILSNFDAPDGRHFVLFEDPSNPDAGVYAYQYDDDGNMDVVTDEKDLEMCEEVLGAISDQLEGGSDGN